MTAEKVKEKTKHLGVGRGGTCHLEKYLQLNKGTWRVTGAENSRC